MGGMLRNAYHRAAMIGCVLDVRYGDQAGSFQWQCEAADAIGRCLTEGEAIACVNRAWLDFLARAHLQPRTLDDHEPRDVFLYVGKARVMVTAELQADAEALARVIHRAAHHQAAAAAAESVAKPPPAPK